MLRAQGYEVRYTYPNLLYISWKHHEREYILKGSPIMSAMLATQNTKPKNELRGQSQTRVRFNEQVQTSSGNTRPPTQQYAAKPSQYTIPSEPQHQTLGRAPPRSTTMYEPPTSFLDVLEKGPVAEPRKTALDDFMTF